MNQVAPLPHVLRVADIGEDAVHLLICRYGLSIEQVAVDSPITGSFWGDPEAGVIGRCVFVRADTPVHSMLHEICHIICMSDERRAVLNRDAGGDDLEESAVCYLQIILADQLPDVGAARLMADMDTWGYSFRLGSTSRWFTEDAADARDWLQAEGLLSHKLLPVFRLREN